MRLTIIISMIISFLLLPSFGYAKEKEQPLVACDQNEDIGSVFYDFDAIYIYYVGFMGQEDSAQNFPKELMFENFNAKLVEAIKKNFSLCLRTAKGEEKPIVVIPPHHIRIPGKQKYNPKLIHNPRNLTLLVRGDYLPGNNSSGFILSFWYRPEVPHKLARLPLSNNSTITILPSRDLDELQSTLNTFFSRIRPMQAVDPHFWGAPDWAIESVKVLKGRE